MKKTLLLSAACLGTLLLSNCASFTTAQQQADYNGDGIVSPAEQQQFMSQRNVEDRAVLSENMKRKNVVEGVRDVTRTVEGVQDLAGSLGIKELGGERGQQRRRWALPY